jgi:hypothetical protein
MTTDTKLENCHTRRNSISPVSYADIKITGIRPVETASESYKKETFSKMPKLIKFKIAENKKICSNLSNLSAYEFLSEHFDIFISVIISPVSHIQTHSSSLDTI